MTASSSAPTSRDPRFSINQVNENTSRPETYTEAVSLVASLYFLKKSI